MNTPAELLAETRKVVPQPHIATVPEPIKSEAVSRTASLHDGQIHALVQQLFFGRESKPVRHAGFAPVEASTTTAALCLDVAKALAKEGLYDVALIDAYPDSVPLHTVLQVPSPSPVESSWTIAPRLWIVPRQNWFLDSNGHNLTDQSLSRLREVQSEFDFSILRCGPISWRTTYIAEACDGLALVLTANKTRRLVAAQIKEQLRKAHIPVLGIILADRRFPVPQGLYRSL